MRAALAILCAIALAGCFSAASSTGKGTGRGTGTGEAQDRPGKAPEAVQRGMATWYGHGQMTASGEPFDPRALTAAHRTLPFGTRVRVTHERSGKSVVVRINDRGPFGKKKRVIDVSKAAAQRLGMIDEGVAPVRLEIVSRPPAKARRAKGRR